MMIAALLVSNSVPLTKMLPNPDIDPWPIIPEPSIPPLAKNGPPPPEQDTSKTEDIRNSRMLFK
jgi:hypothetical protein